MRRWSIAALLLTACGSATQLTDTHRDGGTITDASDETSADASVDHSDTGAANCPDVLPEQAELIEIHAFGSTWDQGYVAYPELIATSHGILTGRAYTTEWWSFAASTQPLFTTIDASPPLTAWGHHLWETDAHAVRHRDLATLVQTSVDFQFENELRIAAGPRGLLLFESAREPTTEPRPLWLLESPTAPASTVWSYPGNTAVLRLSANAPQAAWVLSNDLQDLQRLERLAYDGSERAVIASEPTGRHFSDLQAIPNPNLDGAYLRDADESFDMLTRLLASGQRQDIATDVADYAVDASFVYWIDETALWQQNHCGGPSALLAKLPVETYAIAAHDGTVWLLAGYRDTRLYSLEVNAP